MFCETQLVPARHSPQVGAASRMSRGAPRSASNAAVNWSSEVSVTIGFVWLVAETPLLGAGFVALPHDPSMMARATTNKGVRDGFMRWSVPGRRRSPGPVSL